MLKMMLWMEDKNFERALNANTNEEFNQIRSRGLGEKLWRELVMKANYYAAVKTGNNPFDLDSLLENGKLGSDFTFYKYLYVYSHLPIEKLYKFICDIFYLSY